MPAGRTRGERTWGPEGPARLGGERRASLRGPPGADRAPAGKSMGREAQARPEGKGQGGARAKSRLLSRTRRPPCCSHPGFLPVAPSAQKAFRRGRGPSVLVLPPEHLSPHTRTLQALLFRAPPLSAQELAQRWWGPLPLLLFEDPAGPSPSETPVGLLKDSCPRKPSLRTPPFLPAHAPVLNIPPSFPPQRPPAFPLRTPITPWGPPPSPSDAPQPSLSRTPSRSPRPEPTLVPL